MLGEWFLDAWEVALGSDGSVLRSEARPCRDLGLEIFGLWDLDFCLIGEAFWSFGRRPREADLALSLSLILSNKRS